MSYILIRLRSMNFFKILKAKISLPWRSFVFLFFLSLGSCSEQELIERPGCMITYFSDNGFNYFYEYDRKHRLLKLKVELDDIEIRYSYFSDHIILNYATKESDSDDFELIEGQKVIWINDLGLPVSIVEEDIAAGGSPKYRYRFEYNDDKLKYMVADYSDYADYISKDSVVVTLFDDSGKNISQLKTYHWYIDENVWIEGGTHNLTYSSNLNPFYKFYYESVGESSSTLLLSLFNRNLQSSLELSSADGSFLSNFAYSYTVNSDGYPLASTLYYLDENLDDMPIEVWQSEYEYECR